MGAYQLSLTQARRIAVRGMLLTAERPTDPLDVVRRLTMLKVDPTTAVAPSADLVLWSRIGSAYSPTQLAAALADRRLVEVDLMIRPAEDVALYRAEMAGWPSAIDHRAWHDELADWVRANDSCRLDILSRLRAEGPLPARELPDICALPWKSSGWTNHKNVSRLLDFMSARGEVAVGGRERGERLWDLAERVYPDVPSLPVAEAVAERDRRRLTALGIARPTGPQSLGEPVWVGQAGEPAVVEGVRGKWRVDPALLETADQPVEPRAALISPLDRIVYDRKRLAELWGFDYQLEMYKPASARRWGYWALPVLFGEDFVGKLDAAADRAGGVLQIHDLHQDVDFTPEMTESVNTEIRLLAHWLGLGLSLG